MSTPPPGWYPDAFDPAIERWWDGRAWSPATRPMLRRDAGGRPEPSAQPGAHPVAQPGAQPGQLPGPQPEWPPPAAQPEWPPPAQPEWPPVPWPGQAREPGPGREPGPPPAPEHDPERGSGQPGRSGGPGAPGGPGGPGGPGRPDPWPWRPPEPGRLPPDSRTRPGGGFGPTTPDGRRLAPPGLRLLARIIDAVVTSLLTAVVGWPWLSQLIRALRPSFQAVAAGRHGQDPFTVLTSPELAPVMQRYQFAGLLAGMVYSVAMIHLFGATVGKLTVGIRVQPWEQPVRPTWTQALGRWLTREAVVFVPVLGTMYWVLDSVWLLWDPRRQCLHDKLPGTVVVRRS